MWHGGLVLYTSKVGGLIPASATCTKSLHVLPVHLGTLFAHPQLKDMCCRQMGVSEFVFSLCMGV